MATEFDYGFSLQKEDALRQKLTAIGPAVSGIVQQIMGSIDSTIAAVRDQKLATENQLLSGLSQTVAAGNRISQQTAQSLQQQIAAANASTSEKLGSYITQLGQSPQSYGLGGPSLPATLPGQPGTVPGYPTGPTGAMPAVLSPAGGTIPYPGTAPQLPTPYSGTAPGSTGVTGILSPGVVEGAGGVQPSATSPPPGYHFKFGYQANEYLLEADSPVYPPQPPAVAGVVNVANCDLKWVQVPISLFSTFTKVTEDPCPIPIREISPAGPLPLPLPTPVAVPSPGAPVPVPFPQQPLPLPPGGGTPEPLPAAGLPPVGAFLPPVSPIGVPTQIPIAPGAPTPIPPILQQTPTPIPLIIPPPITQPTPRGVTQPTPTYTPPPQQVTAPTPIVHLECPDWAVKCIDYACQCLDRIADKLAHATMQSADITTGDEVLDLVSGSMNRYRDRLDAYDPFIADLLESDNDDQLQAKIMETDWWRDYSA